MLIGKTLNVCQHFLDALNNLVLSSSLQTCLLLHQIFAYPEAAQDLKRYAALHLPGCPIRHADAVLQLDLHETVRGLVGAFSENVR